MKGTIVIMETTLTETTKEYLALKKTIEEAQEKLKTLEDTIKDGMLSQGMSKLEVDGKVVSLVQAERRSFNADTLKDLVSAAVFKQVTEPTVKTSLFDAAVSLGKIESHVVERVTSKTPYSQLRVK
jgi:predicted  nucleic acid-binding Zn-ribbon protein